jgi:hypothetical protein
VKEKGLTTDFTDSEEDALTGHGVGDTWSHKVALQTVSSAF